MADREVYGYSPLSMTWFGASWHAPVNETCEPQNTPVGDVCLRCGEPIERWASGVITTCFESDGEIARRPLHLECFMRGAIGSVAHQLQRCSCYGGREEDPPGLTRREAARAAVVVFVGHLETWT